jgi:glutamate-1-semialdehyde aminotransferase
VNPAVDAARLANGNALLARAKRSVHGGVKRMNLLDDPAHFPTFFARSAGPHTWDVDHNRYLDLVAGKGSVLIGHADPAVTARVSAAIADGVMQPLTPAEYPAAAELLLATTGIEGQAKFFRTGSCAVTAAVRVARAATGRRTVLSCGYHGWHDWIVERNKEASSGPVPADAEVVDFYYDVSLLRKLLAELTPAAAVVVTPEPALFGRDFLAEVAELTSAAGALLVLDEVKTGFRAGARGYQGVVGIRPDLTTFSKALGNGHPISALAGPAEIMAAESAVHVSGTYETERVGLVAALACLEHYASNPGELAAHQRAVQELADGVNRVFADTGAGARFLLGAGNAQMIFGADDWAREFYRAAARRGLLLYCFDDVNLMLAQIGLVGEILDLVAATAAEVTARLGACPPLTAEAVTGYLRGHRILGPGAEHARRVVPEVLRTTGLDGS